MLADPRSDADDWHGAFDICPARTCDISVTCLFNHTEISQHNIADCCTGGRVQAELLPLSVRRQI